MAGKSRRGFAAMDAEKQREIARKGGVAAHARGTAHEFTTAEARKAGRRGGLAVSRDREHMAEIGRRGGLQSHGGQGVQTNSRGGAGRGRTAAFGARSTGRGTTTARTAAKGGRTAANGRGNPARGRRGTAAMAGASRKTGRR